jgi:hypothetical protein
VGWRHAGGFVWHLAGTDAVRRYEGADGLAEYFPGELSDDPAGRVQQLGHDEQHRAPAGLGGLDVETDEVKAPFPGNG